VPSGSNEFNFIIYKALGDVYKEEGELDKSCSLYEMALYYQPTDLALRFRLAYDYAQIKNHTLSAYHYKLHLKSSQDSMAMNNLGVEYQELNLQGKAVTSYKKAVEGENTLANANLANLYIKEGFFDEAKLILNQAIKKEDHHENVEFYLNQLNTLVDKEEKSEESLLKDAKEHRENILEFAQAISVRFDKYEEIKGLWRTDYGDVKEFSIEFLSPNLLVGEHEIEEARKFAIPPPPSFFKRESEKEIKRIIFSGTIINRGLKFSIKVSKDSQKAVTTLLGALTPSAFELVGFGILSPDGKEIKFVIEKERKIEVFTARKVSLGQDS
jgi:tetratricopeptide (TPR) repeat protein